MCLPLFSLLPLSLRGHSAAGSGRWGRLLSRLRAGLSGEVRALWAGLRDPFLAGLLLLTLALGTLAFQANVPFRLQVGRQPPDLVYLEGVYDVEWGEGRIFRWTHEEAALRVPGLGQAPYRLDLTLAAPRFSAGPEPHLRLLTGGSMLLDAPILPAERVYSLLLPPESMSAGDLELLLRSDAFTPSGDPRVLGVVLRQVELRPAGGPVWPAPGVLLWSVLAVLLVVLLARRLGWSRGVALAAGAAAMLSLAAGLTWGRPLLVPGLPYIPLGLLCAWGAVVLLRGPVGRLFSRGGAELGRRPERLLWTVGAFFLAVRLAGVLHPAMETWDLCFHYHRLESVLRGQLFFTIVSGEWRSQETLYLPSLYLLLAPIWALFGGRLAPLKIAEVLLDTSAAVLVAYAARRLLGRGAAAPLAALFYLTLPYSYLILSWGIVSNVWGQWLLAALVALLVSPAGGLRRWRTWLGAVLLLVLAVLSHPGAVQLAGLLLAGLLLTALLAPLPSLPRPAVGRWLLAGLLAVALAVALYYSYFAATMWRSLQQMGQGANAEQPTQGGILVRGQVLDTDLGLRAVEARNWPEAVAAGAQELAAEARAYFHTGPLLLAAAAMVGLALERRALALRLLGLALWLALAYAVLGLATNLYVRYMYFLLPFVAIGAAWWTERLGQRSWAGRAAGVLLSAALALSGLGFWIRHVLYYSTGCR